MAIVYYRDGVEILPGVTDLRPRLQNNQCEFVPPSPLPVITTTRSAPEILATSTNAEFFTIARSGAPITQPLVVNITLTNVLRYESNAFSNPQSSSITFNVTIPANQSSVQISVLPIEEAVGTELQPVGLIVNPLGGYSAQLPDVVTITIVPLVDPPAFVFTPQGDNGQPLAPILIEDTVGIFNNLPNEPLWWAFTPEGEIFTSYTSSQTPSQNETTYTSYKVWLDYQEYAAAIRYPNGLVDPPVPPGGFLYPNPGRPISRFENEPNEPAPRSITQPRVSDLFWDIYFAEQWRARRGDGRVDDYSAYPDNVYRYQIFLHVFANPPAESFSIYNTYTYYLPGDYVTQQNPIRVKFISWRGSRGNAQVGTSLFYGNKSTIEDIYRWAHYVSNQSNVSVNSNGLITTTYSTRTLITVTPLIYP